MKQRTIKIIIALIAFLVIAAGTIGIYYYIQIQKCKSDDPLVWESAIQDFEKKDKSSSFPENSILFMGSSSIRFWDSLSVDMSPLPVINRGFGGAKIPDLIHYAPRIVFPYEPKTVVVYCGDNDMSMGRRNSPEEVLDNYKRLVYLVKKQLPGIKIFIISIKPSKTRWQYWPDMRKANEMIQDYCLEQNNLEFIDITSAMLDSSGEPREDILLQDGIHMNSEGYKIWTSIIKPVLDADE